MKILLNMTVLQFKMLVRDKALLIGSLGVAVISMCIFGFVFGGTTTQPLAIGVSDLDNSPASQGLLNSLQRDPGLKITTGQRDALVDAMKKGDYNAVVVIQPGFEANIGSGQAKVQFYVDETDQINAARSRGTVNGIFDAVSKQATGFRPLITVEEQKVSVRKLRQIDYLTPGMIGVAVMFANMFVGVALIAWRDRNTLKRLSATPLQSWQLILSQVFAHVALSIVQVAVILTLGIVLFNIQFSPEMALPILVFTVAGAFSIISLGYAVGNFVKKEQSATSVVNLIALPMMFLSGSYFVVSPPDFLKPLVEVLPLTHVNRAFRQIMLSEAGLGSLWVSLALLVAFGAILLTISARTFRWSR
jgi:ABC-2 type transport system permease protein